MFPLKPLIISERIKGNRFAQIHSLLKAKLSKDLLKNKLKTTGRYKTTVIWKIELFESIVNSFQLLAQRVASNKE